MHTLILSGCLLNSRYEKRYLAEPGPASSVDPLLAGVSGATLKLQTRSIFRVAWRSSAELIVLTQPAPEDRAVEVGEGISGPRA